MAVADLRRAAELNLILKRPLPGQELVTTII